MTRMTIRDAWHYDEVTRERLIAGYAGHVRRARAYGLPAIGEGAIFPIEDSLIACPGFEIPKHWLELGALDFGWDHPTAAIRMAYDRDEETFYVTQTYRKRQQTALYHAEKLKGWGRHLPFAWGLEGHQTKGLDNPERQFYTYRRHGLRMMDTHATFASGGVGVEQGVQEMLALMETGKFKVFAHLDDWFEEKNAYHRFKTDEEKVAQIKKTFDDLMDATRYGYMMIRNAVPVSWREVHGGPPSRARRRNADRRAL